MLPRQLLTADEYWQMPGGTASSELLHGEVHRTMPPGAEHGRIVLRLGAKLLAWAEQTKAGYIGTEAGYLLETNPDSVRGPDLSYIRRARIPASGIPKAFWRLAPDVTIECVSPNESASEVREKVRDYLNAGTLLVWLIYIQTRAKSSCIRRMDTRRFMESGTFWNFRRSCRGFGAR